MKAARLRESARPLDGVTVLEYAGFVAGPFCGRLLADMGAEVIKVEPPEGDESRRHGPFLRDDPDPETSALFLYVNANKRSITLALSTPTGAGLFRRLAARVDVLIEDRPPGVMMSWGLDQEALAEGNPRLVYLSITPFGQTGPYARHAAYDMQTFFSGGEGYALPGSLSQELFPGREPVRGGAYLAEYDTGLCAAVAVLSALLARNTRGFGQRLDLSKQEAAMAMTRETLQKYVGYGEVLDRRRAYFFGGIFRAKDGYVTIFPREDRHWLSLCEAMGRQDLAEDPRFEKFEGRAAHKDLLNGVIQAWAQERPRREVYHLVAGTGCPAGYFATAEDLFPSPQLAHRGFFAELEHPRAGRLKHPTSPYLMSRTTPRVKLAAPLLGQDNQEVLCRRLGLSAQDLADLRRAGVV